MDKQQDNNAWSGSDIFANLIDYEASAAESILEVKHSPTDQTANHCQTVAESNEDRDKTSKDVAINAVTAKIGIKIPKFEGTNKNYVLQCQEDMTQEFIDYLKEMSLSYFTSDTGKIIKFLACPSFVKPLLTYHNTTTPDSKF